jgi:hypothetical protein
MLCNFFNTLNTSIMKRKTLFTAAFVAMVAIANAQDSKTSNNTKPSTKNRPSYVDKNANGTCDNYENGTSNHAKRCGKGAGNGNKHGHGKGHSNGKHDGKGHGTNFEDQNGNGVCDHHEDLANKK